MNVIEKPEAEHELILSAEDLRTSELAFTIDDVESSRKGEDLVLTFTDGAKLIFIEYFTNNRHDFPELRFAKGINHLGPDDFRVDWDRPITEIKHIPGLKKDDGTDNDLLKLTQDDSDLYAIKTNDYANYVRQISSDGDMRLVSSDNTSSSSNSSNVGEFFRETHTSLLNDSTLMGGKDHLGPLDTGFTTERTVEFIRHTGGSKDDNGSSVAVDDIIGSSTPPPIFISSSPTMLMGPVENLTGKITLKEAGVHDGGNIYTKGIATAGGRIVPENALDGSIVSWEIDSASLPSGYTSTTDPINNTQSITTLYGTLVLDTLTGKYSYKIDESGGLDQNTSIQKLKLGDSVEENFSLIPKDNLGNQLDDKDGNPAISYLKVTIEGTNDKPELSITSPSSGPKDGETSSYTKTGNFTVKDDDSDGTWTGGGTNNNHRYEISAGSGTSGAPQSGNFGEVVAFTGTYGTLTVNPDGTYQYDLTPDSPQIIALGKDEKHTETFKVKVTDLHGASSEQNVEVIITGKGDAPLFSTSTPTNLLTEHGHIANNYEVSGKPSASGSLTLKHTDLDIQTAEDGFNFKITKAIDAGSITKISDYEYKTDYGTLVISPSSKDGKCEYSFSLDNNSSLVNKLNQGESRTLSFTIEASDRGGAVSKDVSFTINGTNDKPVIELTGNNGTKNLDGSVIHNVNDTSIKIVNSNFTVKDLDSDGIWSSGSGNAGHRYEISAGNDTIKVTGNNGDLGASSTFVSEYGTFTINPNGTYDYKVATDNVKVKALSSSTPPHVDEFVVKVFDKYGAYSEQIIKVSVTGQDNPPTFEAVDTAGRQLKESGHINNNVEVVGIPTYEGTLVASNTDSTGGGITYSIDPKYNDGGSFKIDSAAESYKVKTDYGTLYITPQPVVGGNKYPVKYRFELDNSSEKVQALNDGQEVPLYFTINATDKGGTIGQQLNFVIQGTNDKPILDLKTPPTFVEDESSSEVVRQGQLSSSDIDSGDGPDKNNMTYVIRKDDYDLQIFEGKYGRLELTAGTGSYKYIMNNEKAQSLAEGQKDYDEFIIRVRDKMGAYDEKTLKIEVTGKDDKPTIGNLNANVWEDNGHLGQLGSDNKPILDSNGNPIPFEGNAVKVEGQVSVSDIDILDINKSFKLLASNDTSNSVTDNGNGTYTIQGKYGDLTFNSDGSYTYTLRDNANPEIQKLAPGQEIKESFKIEATTGHDTFSSSSESNLVIAIHGTNDAPKIETKDYTLSVDGNTSILTDTNQLKISDIDQDQQVTVDSSGKITSKYHSFYFERPNGSEIDKLQSVDGKYGTIKVDQHTGEYTYTLNEYAKGLDGSNLIEKFTIVVDDGRGGVANQEITVNLATITNPKFNDMPSDKPPSDGGYTLKPKDINIDNVVKEDDFNSISTNAQVGGTVEASAGTAGTDTNPYGFKDAHDNFTLTVKGKYGTITIDKITGEYLYTLDSSLKEVQELHEGEEVHEEFKLWGYNSSTINITVKGSNDRPSISIDGKKHIEVVQKDGEECFSDKGIANATDVDKIGGKTETLNYTLNDDGTIVTEKYFKLVENGSKLEAQALPNSTGADYKIVLTPNSEGKCEYQLVYLTGGKHLTQGMSTDVEFKVYAIDSNNISTESHGSEISVSEGVTVTATIKGTNTVPVWSNDVDLENAVKEDNIVGGTVTCSGKFNESSIVSDDEGNKGLSFSIMNGNTPTTLMTDANKWGTLQITNSSTGEYKFTLNNEDNQVQSLGEGQSHDVIFTIRVMDKHGGYADKELKITVNGTNDIPTLSVSNITGIGNKGPAISAWNNAVGEDKDVNDILTYSCIAKAGSEVTQKGVVISGSASDYGEIVFNLSNSSQYRFELNKDGEAYKKLKGNETIDLNYQMTVKDDHGASTVKDFIVTVSGENDAPVFETISVVTDWNINSTIPTGKMKATDIDGDKLTYSVKGNSNQSDPHQGEYGYLTMSSDGEYQYTLTISKDDVPLDILNPHDTFTIIATDGGKSVETTLTFNLQGGTFDPSSTSSLDSLYDVDSISFASVADLNSQKFSNEKLELNGDLDNFTIDSLDSNTPLSTDTNEFADMLSKHIEIDNLFNNDNVQNIVSNESVAKNISHNNENSSISSAPVVQPISESMTQIAEGAVNQVKMENLG